MDGRHAAHPVSAGRRLGREDSRRAVVPAASFGYRAIGKVVDQGFEAALNVRPGGEWSWFANYSYQANPELTGIPRNEFNRPPKSRANAGVAFDRGHAFFSASVNYQSRAFWTDVLDARFWGPTAAFAELNGAVGVRLNGHVALSLLGTNIADARVQQHVFGDLLSRRLTVQLALHY